MQVLEHQHGGPSLQFIERGVEDLVAIRARADGLQQRPLGLAGDVEHRRERTGREQRVARAPQKASTRMTAREFPQQHCLAEACLGAHEHDAAAAARHLGQPGRQFAEGVLPLEQVQAHSFRETEPSPFTATRRGREARGANANGRFASIRPGETPFQQGQQARIGRQNPVALLEPSPEEQRQYGIGKRS